METHTDRRLSLAWLDRPEHLCYDVVTLVPQGDAASTFVNDAAARVEVSARSAVAAMAEGDTLRTHLAALRRLLKVTPVNTVARRRRLADRAVQQAGYTL